MRAFSQDFKEFIQCLNANDVAYLIIGGYAVGYHGHPRFTGDLDIWVQMSEVNSAKILLALRDFGFPTDRLSKESFISPNLSFQIGHRPQRIDIITSADGVEFDACYPKKIRFDSAGVSMDIIGLDDLKKNKKASGRNIDLSDLENLE